MQKLISATFIFLFCATLMQAQDLGYVPGAVVTLKKDTLKGYICWLNKLYRQNKIVMYEIKDKKHVRIGYIPERIKGFVLEGNYYESIKYSDEKNHEEGNFAHRKIDGEMKLYAWVVLNPHGKKRWPEHPDSKIDDTELATEDLIKKEMARCKT
ncbi:MAG: hypothetical protein NTX03_01795 [Bacteroidetes bacterium]|nr:hypothetical protein [Bacteroidota bacterium]